jgi:hypothetical protein
MAEKMSRPQLYMPDALWHAFRLACLHRRVSASAVITDLVRQQLAAWEAEERPEPRRKR